MTFTPRQPGPDIIARGEAHEEYLKRVLTERATYARGWRFIGDPGEPALSSDFSMTVGYPIAYFMDSQGFIMLTGECDFVGNFPAGTKRIFTLPLGYRPGKDIHMVEPASRVPVYIGVNGEVYGGATAASGFPDLTRLDGIRFRTN